MCFLSTYFWIHANLIVVLDWSTESKIQELQIYFKFTIFQHHCRNLSCIIQSLILERQRHADWTNAFLHNTLLLIMHNKKVWDNKTTFWGLLSLKNTMKLQTDKVWQTQNEIRNPFFYFWTKSKLNPFKNTKSKNRKRTRT